MCVFFYKKIYNKIFKPSFTKKNFPILSAKILPRRCLNDNGCIYYSYFFQTWRGRWQKNDVVAKILNVREVIPRVTRDFNEEYPRLRIFSHPNVLPVIGCCCHPPSLIVINQYMPYGSLYTVLHEGTGNNYYLSFIFGIHGTVKACTVNSAFI